MTAPAFKVEPPAFTRRLDEVGWALFFVSVGVFLLLPHSAPFNAWLFAAGAILLGINAVRYMYGYRMHVGTSLLGLLALVAGVEDALHLQFQLFPIALIVAGLAILLKAFVGWRAVT